MNIGYVRVSTGKQHPENQKDEISRYALANGIMVEKWVVEVVSGKTKINGRRLGGLIRRMKKGDTIIVTEISRLSRSLTDIMDIMGKCVSKGINLYTTKEGYKFDDTINSKVLCFAFGLVAEIERNLISLRTKEALAARKAEGKSLGRVKGYAPKMQLLKSKMDMIDKMRQKGLSNNEICRACGVSKATYYKFLKQIADKT